MGLGISLVSLKDGVGKTTLAVNLAYMLGKVFGKKVVVVDGDFSNPSLALSLGYTDINITLHDIIEENTPLEHALYATEYGFHLLPGPLSGMEEKHQELSALLVQLQRSYDVVILDTAALTPTSLPLLHTGHDQYIVTTPDILGLHDTLRLLQEVKEHKKNIRGIILNKYMNTPWEKQKAGVERLAKCPVVGHLAHSQLIAQGLGEHAPGLALSANETEEKEYMALCKKMIHSSPGSFLFGLFSSKADIDFTPPTLPPAEKPKIIAPIEDDELEQESAQQPSTILPLKTKKTKPRIPKPIKKPLLKPKTRTIKPVKKIIARKPSLPKELAPLESSPFYLSDGRVIHNLKELSVILTFLDQSVFDHHVNTDRNDFANWVGHSLGNNRLAQELYLIQDRIKMAKKVKEFA